MRIYLVRHGHSKGNLGFHVSDPELTEIGKQQAELVGERLRQEEIDILLCSPLKRSLSTAEAIGRHIDKTAIVWPELIESWDGSPAMPAHEIREAHPDFSVDFPERWWPEAEREEDLYARASRAEARLRSLGDDTERRLVAVSHGSFGAVLISRFLGAPPCGYTRFSQHNCCISILQVQPGRAKLYRGNDVSHLTTELLT